MQEPRRLNPFEYEDVIEDLEHALAEAESLAEGLAQENTELERLNDQLTKEVESLQAEKAQSHQEVVQMLGRMLAPQRMGWLVPPTH